MGGEGRPPSTPSSTCRSRSLGLPFAFLALGGQGYLRGISDLRTPLVIEVVANAVNVVLVVLFVYGFDWGIQGSAVGDGDRAGRAWGSRSSSWMLRAHARAGSFGPSLRRRAAALGRTALFVRTAALYGSFVVAGAVAARFGDAAIGAHQIAFQLWIFLALVLDAIAIAGQVIVGRMLGAGGRTAPSPRARG